MRIETDGTPIGTKVYDDVGEVIHGVQAVRRIGPKTWIITKHRNVEVNGIDGDFAIALPSAILALEP
jgi:hypothetical protein